MNAYCLSDFLIFKIWYEYCSMTNLNVKNFVYRATHCFFCKYGIMFSYLLSCRHFVNLNRHALSKDNI